ncbi:MAG: hypothetical protein ACM3ML_31775 [Micromonosporaceae bacterium]
MSAPGAPNRYPYSTVPRGDTDSDRSARMVSRARGLRPGQQYEADARAAFWAPAVDISECKDASLVTAEIPGVTPGDVEITFEDGLLRSA